MKTILLIALAVSFTSFTLLAAGPTIASPGIYNSASYAIPGFPNGGIAQGSIFTVFGSGLGPAEIAYNSSLPYQNSLAGTSVMVTVNGTNVPCLMFYTSAGQVAAILPSTAPAGTGTMTVTYNGATSPAVPVTVVKNAVGLFTRNQQGSGPAVAQDANGNYNSLTNAFHPAQTVTFWGTGLGAISGSDATTPPSGAIPGANVAAYIGGQVATVQYAGRSGYSGEDQINLVIPSGVTGCYVPVYLTVNGIPSNFSSISIAQSGSVCSDPGLYQASDLQNLANGGTLNIGNVILSQYTLSASVLGLTLNLDTESGSGTFEKYTSNSFLNSLGGLNTLAVTVGSCSVFEFAGSQYVDPVTVPVLDAGPQINVNPPSGAAKVMQKTTGGNYQATFVAPSANPLAPPPAHFLVPGTFALDNGSGGKDVGPFKLNITVPPTLTWTNKASVTNVPRSQDLKITWSGGDPNSLVYVIGESPLDANNNNTGEFVCVGKDSDLGLTVPAQILSALPPSANISEGGFQLPGGVIIVNTTSTTRGTAPGLDVLLAGASQGDGKIGIMFQ